MQHGRQEQETGPSERHPEPELALRLDTTSPPASTPGAPAIGAPSTLIPRPEATQDQLEPAATPAIPDLSHQEPILDSLNTDDIPSLHQWATEGLRDSATPATGSQGPTGPIIRITPGSVTRSRRRRIGSVQTNLFGGTPEEPIEGFCRWMKEQIAQQVELSEEAQSSSKGEEDPVDEDNDEENEEKDDEEEDEEEEEDPGSNDAYR